MNIYKSWYILNTVPRFEKKVAEALSKKKIENYCPLNTLPKQFSEKRKNHPEPLFLSYVFVYSAKDDLNTLMHVSGVRNIVHWLGAPAIVREEEISAIKSFLGEFASVRIEKTRVSLTEKVRVIQGSSMLREGKIVQISSNVLKLELPSLGYALIAAGVASNITSKIYNIDNNQAINPIDGIDDLKVAVY